MMWNKIALLFFIFATFVNFSDESETKVNGKSYIQFNMPEKRQILGVSETLSLNFKTIHPSGLLFYGDSTSGQFVSLELVHGKLRYTINLVNSASNNIQPFTLTYGEKLCDNTWHNVRLTRDKQKLRLYLDSKQAKTVDIKLSKQQSQYYLVISSFYVGGTWNAKNNHGAKLTKNFVGCLGDVLFNAYHPISDAKRNKTGYQITGNLLYKCPATKFQPITFTSNMAVLKIPTTASKYKMSVSFTFRTYDRNGIMLYRDGTVSVYVYLKDGKLKFDYIAGLKAPLTLDTSTFVSGDLNDGAWHMVKVSVDGHFMLIEVDHHLGVNTSAHLDDNTRLVFENVTYVGGGTYYREMHGFVGCMKDLVVNDVKIDLMGLKKPPGIASRFVVKGKCTTTSLCHPSACKYSSTCVQKLDNYTCECRRFYTGRHCEVPLYQPNCQKYKEFGMQQDAHCIVDPDTVGPLREFRVLCNMTAGVDAVTIVNHTIGGQSVLVQHATRYSDSRENWFHRINYGVPTSNLRALVANSDHCRQYVQFDCINTKFFDSDDDDVYGASWISTDGQNRYYWGGATKRAGCGCGDTKSCHDTTKRCNCETGDGVWRRDAGYITEKADLPVMGIFFPDTAKDSRFTLGPLECFGGRKQLKRDKSERKYVDIACQPLVTTPPPVYPWITLGQTTPKQPHGNTGKPTSGDTAGYQPVTQPSKNATPELQEKKNTVTTYDVGTNNSGVDSVTTSTPRNNSDGDPVNVLSVKKNKEKERSWLFIVIIAASVVVFIVLLAFMLVVVRHKRVNGVWCTGLFKFSTCGQHQQLPKIEIYRHSLATDSPDILHMGDFKNSKVIDLHIHRGHFAKKKPPKRKKTVTFKDETC